MKTFRLIGAGLLAVLLSFAFTACSGDDEEDNENKEPSKYNAVDLGLPSGTLWADRNIGADFPEDSGDYFAWGETATKDYFDWDTYKYGYDRDELTKYNCVSEWGFNGFTDNKTRLETIDDAATVNMGKKWRMPTEDEFYELIKKCRWSRTSQNGIYGCKVTGLNGNSIFLPLVRPMWQDQTIGANGYGYWSSDTPSVESDSSFLARVLCIHESEVHIAADYRTDGRVVRAVTRQ